MRVSHECTASVTPQSAVDRLQAFMAERRSSKQPCGDMEGFERELHGYVVAVEREVLAEELTRLDVDLPAVTIEGEVYRQVVRCEETYTSAAGPVRVMRSLYRRSGEGEQTVCPLELRAGMIEGRWTPLAARQAAFVVAHLTPQEGEDLFRVLANMVPSNRASTGCPSNSVRTGKPSASGSRRRYARRRRCPRRRSR
jgi:hypothetical protein